MTATASRLRRREQKQLPAVRAQIRSVCALCAHPDSRKLAASGTDAQPPAPWPQVGDGRLLLCQSRSWPRLTSLPPKPFSGRFKPPVDSRAPQWLRRADSVSVLLAGWGDGFLALLTPPSSARHVHFVPSSNDACRDVSVPPDDRAVHTETSQRPSLILLEYIARSDKVADYKTNAQNSLD